MSNIVQQAETSNASGINTLAPTLTVSGGNLLVSIVLVLNNQGLPTLSVSDGKNNYKLAGVSSNALTPITFLTPLLSGATTGTMTTNWNSTTSGNYIIQFSDSEWQYATLTSGSPVATFSALTNNVTANASVISPSNLVMAMFYAPGVAAGSTTVTASTTGNYLYGHYVAELTGVAASNALLGFSSNYQNGPGAANDTITSGTIALAQNAELFGFTCDLTGPPPTQNAAIAGTGFSAKSGVWATYAGGTYYCAIAEDQIASSSAAATFDPVYPGGTEYDQFQTMAAAFALGSGPQAVLGRIPGAGPGVSPAKQLTFRASPRSAQTYPGLLQGKSFATSFLFGSPGGSLIPLQGQSYSSSANFGQLLGTAGLTGQSYAFTFDYAALISSSLLVGRIPGPGPGVSPSSAYQFASQALETTSIAMLALSGKTISTSALYGKAAGAAALSGQTDAFSISYGPMLLSAIGQITGNSYSFANLWGQGIGVGLTYMAGVSYSVNFNLGQLITFLIVPVVSYPGATLTQAQAMAILTALGFTVTVGTVNTQITPPGLVAQQYPAGGTEAPIGSNVQILVSIGPSVRAFNPNLGYRVTTRQFSLEELVAREWGPSFRAPDHKIYVWSNQRAFDSTDIGNTGIYQKGTSTS